MFKKFMFLIDTAAGLTHLRTIFRRSQENAVVQAMTSPKILINQPRLPHSTPQIHTATSISSLTDSEVLTSCNTIITLYISFRNN